MREAFRAWFGLPRHEPIPVMRWAYVVRHPRLAIYWRDPYGRYARAGDPQSDWTPEVERAYRFAERHHALEALRETGTDGFVLVTNR